MAERAHNNTCGESDGKLKRGFDNPPSPETHRRPLMHSKEFSEINSLYEQRDSSVRGQIEKCHREREWEQERDG